MIDWLVVTDCPARASVVTVVTIETVEAVVATRRGMEDVGGMRRRDATASGGRGGETNGRGEDGDARDGVRTIVAREVGGTNAVVENLEMDALRDWTASMNRGGEAERSSGMESVWKYCALELGFCVGEREDDRVHGAASDGSAEIVDAHRHGSDCRCRRTRRGE